MYFPAKNRCYGFGSDYNGSHYVQILLLAEAQSFYWDSSGLMWLSLVCAILNQTL